MKTFRFALALFLAGNLSDAAARDKVLDGFFENAPLSHVKWSAAWRVAREKQPPGLRCTLSLPKTHYYPGEVMRASLIFSNETGSPWHMAGGSGSRAGRTYDIRFWAVGEDGAPVPDGLEKYFGHSVQMGGGGTFDEKRTEPWKIHTIANQWVQFERPGTYKLYAWALRMAPGKQSDSSQRGDSCVDIVTDPVEITVDPLPASEEKATIEGANQMLARAYKFESLHRDDIDAPDFLVVERLRFLQTPAAQDLLLQFMDSNYYEEARLGLLASPDYATLEEKILTGLKEGTVGLSEYLPYLYADLKRVDSWMKDGHIFGDISWEALRDDLFAAARKAMKPDGQGSAFFCSLTMLFLQNPQDPAIRAIMVNRQLDLPPQQIDKAFHKRFYDRGFLKSSPLADRDFLPLLRELVKPERHDPFALAALASVAPDEARPIIVEDIKRQHPLFLLEENNVHFRPEHVVFALLKLPAKEMPELDSVLQDKLSHPEANFLSHEALQLLFDRYGIKPHAEIRIQGVRIGGPD